MRSVASSKTGVSPHDFHIDDLNVHSSTLEAGAAETVTIPPAAPGTYQFYCSIPGHQAAGMVGTLTVQ